MLAATAATASAWAQEPAGCDKFKWPVEQERALLAKTAPVASGGALARPLSQAVAVALVPLTDVKLPLAPQRAPKTADSLAGFLRVAAPPASGTYRVTLSHDAWIDVIQDGHEVDSAAFTGALACSGVRKSVQFVLKAEPFIIQIQLTGTTAHSLRVVVTPD
jgi:hypothetical protein